MAVERVSLFSTTFVRDAFRTDIHLASYARRNAYTARHCCPVLTKLGMFG
jgi:hypothetical protein